MRFELDTASVEIEVGGDVLTITGYGIFDSKALAAAIELAWCLREPRPYAGFLIRLDRVTYLRANTLDWRRHATRPEMVPASVSSPGAVVVSRIELARSSSLAMARALEGRVLGVFTDAEKATCWVRSRGAVMRAQVRARTLAPSAEQEEGQT